MRENTGSKKTGSGGSGTWVPHASYCTTGQFMKLQGGYQRHCGPTAMVNLIRTLDSRASAGKRIVRGRDTKELFLLCASIGQKTHIYWNKEILGLFGGTSNFLTAFYLRRCLRAAGLQTGRDTVRFHLWITPDAVAAALDEGAIVYLQVYRHRKYKDHHMLCYAYQTGDDGARMFLLADGWSFGPVWVSDRELGHGHYLTIIPPRGDNA